MTTSTSTKSDNDPVQLSDYEKLRLHNIHRNEAKLKELGLLRPITIGKKRGPKRGVDDTAKNRKPKGRPSVPSRPTRTSGRKRKVISYYTPDTAVADDDENNLKAGDTDDESDYDENALADHDVDDSDDESTESLGDPSPPPPSKRKKRGTVKSTGTAITQKIEQNQRHDTNFTDLGGISVEHAKSGRATCRKCRDKIPKDAPRVGMQAWIVGRQAITWQCPPCFLSNLTCCYDSSGRSRCKITGEMFGKGELKVGTRSHTATLFFRVDVVGRIITAVVRQIEGGDDVREGLLNVERVDGYERLKEEDRAKLQDVLSSCAVAEPKLVLETTGGVPMNGAKGSMALATPDVVEKRKTKVGADEAVDVKIPQPKLGQKSGGKGRVEWKFGGRLCYGTLLPSKETKTHCYARTHKGNVKTLAKGKGYWSILA